MLNYVKCGSDVDFIEGHGRGSWNFHPVATKDIQRIPKITLKHYRMVKYCNMIKVFHYFEIFCMFLHNSAYFSNFQHISAFFSKISQYVPWFPILSNIFHMFLIFFDIFWFYRKAMHGYAMALLLLGSTGRPRQGQGLWGHRRSAGNLFHNLWPGRSRDHQGNNGRIWENMGKLWTNIGN